MGSSCTASVVRKLTPTPTAGIFTTSGFGGKCYGTTRVDGDLGPSSGRTGPVITRAKS
jgi:hypothetical protein